jgi:hypothetical protein
MSIRSAQTQKSTNHIYIRHKHIKNISYFVLISKQNMQNNTSSTKQSLFQSHHIIPNYFLPWPFYLVAVTVLTTIISLWQDVRCYPPKDRFSRIFFVHISMSPPFRFGEISQGVLTLRMKCNTSIVVIKNDRAFSTNDTTNSVNDRFPNLSAVADRLFMLPSPPHDIRHRIVIPYALYTLCTVRCVKRQTTKSLQSLAKLQNC